MVMMSEEINKKTWSCKLCPNSFFNEEKNLKTYKKIYHGDTVQRFKCVYCDKKVFAKASNLIELHKAIHTSLQLPAKEVFTITTKNDKSGLKFKDWNRFL